jgi:hypothetical protein
MTQVDVDPSYDLGAGQTPMGSHLASVQTQGTCKSGQPGRKGGLTPNDPKRARANADYCAIHNIIPHTSCGQPMNKDVASTNGISSASVSATIC